MTINIDNKIWMMRFTNDHHFDIVEEVLSKRVKVSLITGNQTTLNHLKRRQNNSIEFIDNNEISSLAHEYIQYEKNIDNSLFKDSAYKYFYYALQIMERNERFQSELSFEERNYIIFRQVKFWRDKIKNNTPRSVVFMDLPHMYYEWVIMALLEEEKIPFMVIAFTPSLGSIFLDNRLNLIQGYGGSNFYDANKDYLERVIQQKEKKWDIKINSNNVKKRFFFKNLSSYILKFFFLAGEYKAGYFIKNGYFSTGWNRIRSERLAQVIYSWKSVYFKKYYKGKSLPADYSQKYVYLPMVSGYENTFHPNCSPLNIIVILEYLSNSIPEGWSIYLKEHPAQFTFRYNQKFARSIKLYQRINNIEKVKLINLNEPHFNLIKNSQFIVGSSMSSISYQAIALKKIFKYVGLDLLPNEYSEPLFTKKNQVNIDNKSKFFHSENAQTGSKEDARSIAKKIINWVDDQEAS
jgi:hypothetical protein